MKPIKPWKRAIAPRLANGRSRESWGGRLPEDVKYALYMIAKREGVSVSFLMEKYVIKEFNLKVPDYLKPKPKPVDDAQRAQQDLAEANARERHRKRVA